MINISKNEVELLLLTSEQAKEYLQKKPQYLAIWNKVIPYHFKATEFCNLINDVRIKRIEKTEKMNQEIITLQRKKEIAPQDSKRIKSLQEQKKTVFFDTLREMFGSLISSKIKNTNITYNELTQLIGSLASGLRSPKDDIQEITKGVNRKIHEDISRIETYEDSFSTLVEDHIEQYFTSKGIGTISEGERKEIGQQIWGGFIKKYKKHMKKDKIDKNKFNTYLHSKNLL